MNVASDFYYKELKGSSLNITHNILSVTCWTVRVAYCTKMSQITVHFQKISVPKSKDTFQYD